MRPVQVTRVEEPKEQILNKEPIPDPTLVSLPKAKIADSGVGQYQHKIVEQDGLKFGISITKSTR